MGCNVQVPFTCSEALRTLRTHSRIPERYKYNQDIPHWPYYYVWSSTNDSKHLNIPNQSTPCRSLLLGDCTTRGARSAIARPTLDWRLPLSMLSCRRHGIEVIGADMMNPPAHCHAWRDSGPAIRTSTALPYSPSVGPALFHRKPPPGQPFCVRENGACRIPKQFFCQPSIQRRKNDSGASYALMRDLNFNPTKRRLDGEAKGGFLNQSSRENVLPHHGQANHLSSMNLSPTSPSLDKALCA